MPAVTRKVTQATSSFSKAIVAMEREMPQKRHTFVSAPTELASPAFAVSVAQDATGITLRVRNNLAHSVPTGDFGFRVALLEAFTVDAKGTVRYLGQRELIKQLGTGLPPQTLLEWKLPAAKGARSVLVRIRRLGRESAPAAELFKTEVPL